MKTLNFTLIFLIFSLTSFSQANSIENNIPGLIDEYDGRWYTVNVEISPNAFFKKYKAPFGFSNKDSFDLLDIHDIGNGYVKYSFQQYFSGIKVEGAIGFFYVVDGFVKKFHSDFVKRVKPNLGIIISEDQALTFAKNFLGFKDYCWETQLDSNIPHLDIFEKRPIGEMVYEAEIGDLHHSKALFELCWKFRIADGTLHDVRNVFVNAENGRIVNTYPISMACSKTNGSTAYNGTQSISTMYYNSTNGYRLTDDCGGTYYSARLITELYDNNNYYFYWNLYNDWTSNGPLNSVTTHWAGKMALKYWGDYWGRNSFDGYGSDLYIYNQTSYYGARWSGYYIYIGDNNSSGIYDDWNTIDIVGHEFAHGVTQYTAGLVYEKESGALNESFSDIFGTALERNTFGTNNYNFLIGEDRGSAIRNMANPSSYNDPDTYQGKDWESTSCTPSDLNDFCGVHTNSGVHNYWFYLLAAGGSGTNDNGFSYNVTGLNFTDAIAIAYKNLTGYLTQYSNYGDARLGSIWAAEQLFGKSSTQRATVIASWCAVGMGNTCSNTVDLQRTGNAIFNYSGNVLEVGDNVINTGSASSGNFKIGYYLSNDAVFSSLDYKLGVDNISSLSSNSSATFSKTFNLCSLSIPNGTYYVGYVIDDDNVVTESNESNNTLYWGSNPISVSCNSNYNVILSSNPTTGGIAYGSGSYTPGYNLTITATANSGWKFDNWTEGSNVISSNATYQLTVNSDRIITANFSQSSSTYFLTLNSNPSNGGGVTGGGSYSTGQTATITAAANSGWKFDNWTEGSNIISSNTTYQFTVNSDRTLTANYSQSTSTYFITLNSNPSNGGGVAGGGSYSTGQTATITATANSGWKFDNWTEGSNIISSNATYQFTVSSTRNIVANFSANGSSYSIQLKANPSNGGSVLGDGNYISGLQATVVAISEKNWKFLNWTDLLNGSVIVSTNSSYQFVVNADRHLVATFIPETSGIVDNQNKDYLQIFPNPNSGLFTIQYKSVSSESIKMEIFNQIGQRVYSSINRNESSILQKEIDMHAPAGIYYLILSADSGIFIEKIILTK